MEQKVNQEPTRNHRPQREGIVIRNKMEKTVIVRVDRTYRDPKYHKVITRGRKYYAHDESNSLELGQKVIIKECRPLSKTKRWMVVKTVERK